MFKPRVYRVTPRCEVTFTPMPWGKISGSVGIVIIEPEGRKRLYFCAQGCYYAETAEHTPEDRLAFEQGLRDAVREYWRNEVDPDQEIIPLRINYPSKVRRSIAPYPLNYSRAGVR